MRIGSIRKSCSFRTVVTRGRRFRGSLLQISFLEEPESDTLNLGVTVAKKLAKRATQRNYLKRITRGFLLRERERLGKGGWLAVRLTSPVGDMKKAELSEKLISELGMLLNKGGILAKKNVDRDSKGL